MSRLEMLTKAADLVESETYEETEANGNGPSHANGIAETESKENSTHNGTHEFSPKSRAELQSASNNHHVKGSRDNIKPLGGRNVERASAPENTFSQESQRLYSYPHRVDYPERTNGTVSQIRPEQVYRKPLEDNNSPSRKSPDRFQANIPRRSSSPASERGGDTHSTTKPMVLLQQPAATTLSSVGTVPATRITNPGIPIPTMHHPYMYPLLYQPGATIDSVLGPAMSRAPGVLKESEGLVSSPNRSPNDGLSAATAAGLHIPGLVYPFANHPAFLMGARPPGADLPPVLMGPSSGPYPAALDQYKRMLEGMQFSPYPGLNPQLTDQYLKALAATQGLDATKEALALNAMTSRIPPGISLAAQPGAELLLRYPEHWPAAMGILHPPDGVSPRSGSPFAVKRRTESPVILNGNKTSASSYPFHAAHIAQTQINNMTAGRNLSRSPAALLSQGARTRSPPVEVRKPDVDRSRYRSHSRDLDREMKSAARDLASASMTNNNGRGRNNSSEQVPPYSVTDENGRKIPVPAFYGPPTHVPYPIGLPSHHTSDRSPSPRSRDERSGYHRPPRERSPPGVEAKRRALESRHIARDSPVMTDRHSSRPPSPQTNGLMQVKLANGNTETTVAADIPKHNAHLLLQQPHTRSPNPAGFSVDGREQRNSSPSPNPYLVAGVSPFLNPHLIPGLTSHAGAHYMLSSQYAQALAKGGMDLSSLYKTGENAEYSRLAGLQLLQQQQQILAGSRPPALSQEYVAALKNAAYFPSQLPARDGDKSSPANVREKLQVLPTQMHATLMGQPPPKAHSPVKVGLKPKSNESSQMGTSTHHSKPEPHSPTGSGNIPATDSRRYHQSPNVSDRPSQEVSPKQQQSSKPYRPNSMLRQHAIDLERNRKRKMMMEEESMREDSAAFVREKHRNEREKDYTKDDRKDPKRVKQVISENDPEEHFRRSLGKDYKETSNKVNISGSVDEHFKKALGHMYEQVHGGGSAAKNEARDATSSSAHHLPPYSVAVAAASQSNRMFSAHQDAKEPTPRYYEQPFLARDRYYLQTSPHHNRKAQRSPPSVPSSGTTVIYPQNPAVMVPARQKVKAKAAFIPEAASSEAHMGTRPGRTNSDGGKSSTRSMSGSSYENLPSVTAPTSSPPTALTSDVLRSNGPPVMSQCIPYSFGHQTNVSNAHMEASSSTNGVNQRMRNSPTSSSRNPDQEEAVKVHVSGSPTRGYPTPVSASHRESTESTNEEGRGST